MAKSIIDSIYPLTVIMDRYTGAYSGGKFTAWNLEPSEMPTGMFSDDVGCMEFWDKNEIPCGIGNTIEEAIGNLYIALNTPIENNLIENRNDLLKLITEACGFFDGTGKSACDIKEYIAEYLAANGAKVERRSDDEAY